MKMYDAATGLQLTISVANVLARADWSAALFNSALGDFCTVADTSLLFSSSDTATRTSPVMPCCCATRRRLGLHRVDHVLRNVRPRARGRRRRSRRHGRRGNGRRRGRYRCCDAVRRTVWRAVGRAFGMRIRFFGRTAGVGVRLERVDLDFSGLRRLRRLVRRRRRRAGSAGAWVAAWAWVWASAAAVGILSIFTVSTFSGASAVRWNLTSGPTSKCNRIESAKPLEQKILRPFSRCRWRFHRGLRTHAIGTGLPVGPRYDWRDRSP